MIEEIVQQLWQASEAQKTCRIILKNEPFPRVIAPFGVCKSSKNEIVLVCKQLAGFTKAGGKAGYRNLALKKINEVEILSQKFEHPTDFNPLDSQYKEWVYHI